MKTHTLKKPKIEKIGSKDITILRELQKDSKQGIEELSKKTKIPKETG